MAEKTMSGPLSQPQRQQPGSGTRGGREKAPLSAEHLPWYQAGRPLRG